MISEIVAQPVSKTRAPKDAFYLLYVEHFIFHPHMMSLLSVVSLPSVNFHAVDISKTTGSVLTKLGQNSPRLALFKNYVTCIYCMEIVFQREKKTILQTSH